MYVYRELKGRADEIAYFGIPTNIDWDGILPSGVLCHTKTKMRGHVIQNCKSLTKTYYLQYQWMPFFVATLCVLYYLPYLLFRSVNPDLISLKDTLKGGEAKAQDIVTSYFNRNTTSVRLHRFRVAMNIVVKLLYLVANLIAFLSTDHLLNGDFVDYGNQWHKWAQLNNSVAYDYMGLRDHPKPGNFLLPPFGLCDLSEVSRDQRHVTENSHRLVCELSQNVLYQYALLVMWWMIVVGITVSCVGLCWQVGKLAFSWCCICKQGKAARKLLRVITMRELEYLEFIKKRNIPLYTEVISQLKGGLYEMKVPEDEYPHNGLNQQRKMHSLYPNLAATKVYGDEKVLV